MRVTTLASGERVVVYEQLRDHGTGRYLSREDARRVPPARVRIEQRRIILPPLGKAFSAS